jgi:quercetin dioxygenase-like cupin family protein
MDRDDLYSGGSPMIKLLSAIAMAAVVYPASAQDMPIPDASHPVFMLHRDLKWTDYGIAKVTTLHIDPKTNTTEMMIWNPKNTHVPKHWHSANEKISVISGVFVMQHEGGGDPVELNPGSFAYMPAKMIHEGWTKPDTEALYFVTVDGAWDYNVVEGAKADK